MKLDLKQAKELSTNKELELFDNARPPRLNKLTVAELKQMVKRSRMLRDKLRDVKRGETRSAQAKAAQRGKSAADRTVEKAKLYAEVHDTFVKRLESVEKAAAAKADKAKTLGKKVPERKAPVTDFASAAIGKGVPAHPEPERSVKATTASKAAIDPTAGANQSPQTVAERWARRGKIVETRIAKGGALQMHGHASSLNKRNQGKRDSRKPG